MRALNPFTGEFYREALQVSRWTREMFCLMEGRHVHPSTLYPGGVGTTATIQLMTDYMSRLMRYVEFMKSVVPMHDDLFDFFYEALPGYDQVGLRRTLLGCWGSFQDPEVCNFEYKDMEKWGNAMFVTPGVVIDGKLHTHSLVDINLGIRILLGSSYYDDWSDQEMFVKTDPLGNPVDRRHPWNQHTNPRPQKRDFESNYSWVMSPRWFDGKDHLALDTGGGPLARLWSTALAGLVDIGYVKATGNSVQINLPKTALKGPVSLEWKVPQYGSNTIERNRARTYFQAYAAACALHFAEKALVEIRAGRTKTWEKFDRAGRGHRLRIHRGGARGAEPPHGHPRRQDRELPSVSADAVERESSRQLRHAGTVRGCGSGSADLRGERPGALQGHRHHAHGAKFRSVPALRCAHVSGRGEDAGEVALPHPIRHRGITYGRIARRNPKKMRSGATRAIGYRISSTPAQQVAPSRTSAQSSWSVR